MKNRVNCMDQYFERIMIPHLLACHYAGVLIDIWISEELVVFLEYQSISNHYFVQSTYPFL